MKDYIITFRNSVQISPEDFDVYDICIKINENTTLKEIEKAYRKHIKVGYFQIKVVELETINE